eukprot:scaffold84371_cov51-Phaeocystis_antarctica.AAC.1
MRPMASVCDCCDAGDSCAKAASVIATGGRLIIGEASTLLPPPPPSAGLARPLPLRPPRFRAVARRLRRPRTRA